MCEWRWAAPSGAEEDEAWRWLIAKYRIFDRKAPATDAAHQFLSAQLARHLAGQLHGQPVVARMQSAGRGLDVAFEPEVLPRIQAVSFTGNHIASSEELRAALETAVRNQGYTARKFRVVLEGRLRPFYEERGRFRVRFEHTTPSLDGASASVLVAIEREQRTRWAMSNSRATTFRAAC